MAFTKKITGAIAAIALVLTTVLTFASKSGDNSSNKKQVASLWHYVGTANPGVYYDAANWAQGSGSCGLGGSLPCEITVDADDETELNTFFDDMDNADVLAINPSSRRN